MLKRHLLWSALALCIAGTASADVKIEKFTLDGYQFESYLSSAKSLGNGEFEITIGPGKGWPMIHITPPGLLPDANRTSITIQQIKPEGRAPKRIFLEYTPVKQLGSEPLQNLLADGKKHVVTSTVKEGVRFQRFSINAHAPEQPIVLRISNLKAWNENPSATLGKDKPKLAALPPVMFQGKPFFPLGCFDGCDIPRTEFGLDPGLFEAGGNTLIVGDLGLPGHKWYEKYRQPVLFKRLEYAANSPEYRDLAFIVGIDCVLLWDGSESEKPGLGGYFKPLAPEQIAERSKFLAEDLRRLAKCPNILGYTVDEPENILWPYFKKHRAEDWEKYKEMSLSKLIIDTSAWARDLIRKEHPGAKFMPIIAWWTSYQHMADFYDVNIPNEYPGAKVGAPEFDGGFYAVNYDAALAVAAARQHGGGRTVVYMPAMFQREPMKRADRSMTLREQRYCCFAPLTRGAMGIFGWRQARCDADYRDNVVYPVLSEISELKDYFLGEWFDELVSSDHDTASVDYLRKFKEVSRMMEGEKDGEVKETKFAVPDVSYCLRRNPADGTYLLLAVNNRKEPVTVNFLVKIPGLAPVARCHIDRHQVRIKDGIFTDRFDPFDVHAYILRKAK